MKITSPAFQMNQPIPSLYTCDGNNVNPLLEFSDIPAGTQSLTLIMHDPDVPKSLRADGNFDHWILFNLPATLQSISSGATNIPGLFGKNTRGQNGYTGPCPPDREHRYFFTLFAVSRVIDLEEGATRTQLETAMHDHIIASAVLVGTYNRSQ